MKKVYLNAEFFAQCPNGYNEGQAVAYATGCAFAGCPTMHNKNHFYEVADANGKRIAVQVKGYSAPIITNCEGVTLSMDWDTDIAMYMRNSAANAYAYVPKRSHVLYLMTPREFQAFVTLYHYADYESNKNGGKDKWRILRREIEIIEYLDKICARYEH